MDSQMVIQTSREQLSRFSSLELMEALMAADMPLGGTNAERIERLLSVARPNNIFEFFSPSALRRVSAA